MVRIRNGLILHPRTNVFGVLPREVAESLVDVKDTVIRIFSSGFDATVAFVGFFQPSSSLPRLGVLAVFHKLNKQFFLTNRWLVNAVWE